MNKKASFHVLLFVIFTIVVCSIAVFTFLTNSERVEDKISKVESLNKVYFKEELTKFYLKQAGENAFVKTYNDIASKGDYGIEYNLNKEVKLGDLNKLWKEDFAESFSENFKAEFLTYKFDENYLLNVQEAVKRNDFVIKDDFSILFENLNFKESVEGVSVLYSPKINLKFDFEKIGLVDFEELYKSKIKCASSDNIENCFNEELKNFDTDILKKQGSEGDYDFVYLESKREFFIKQRFEKIKFGFVLI